MKKCALNLFLIVMMAMFSFTAIARTGDVPFPFTEIGHQVDENYYYTFYLDLSKDGPNAIAYIQVQKNTTGEVLKLNSFSGKVQFRAARFSIENKATVSFYDGNNLISRDLKGSIDGAIKP